MASNKKKGQIPASAVKRRINWSQLEAELEATTGNQVARTRFLEQVYRSREMVGMILNGLKSQPQKLMDFLEDLSDFIRKADWNNQSEIRDHAAFMLPNGDRILIQRDEGVARIELRRAIFDRFHQGAFA